MSKNKWVECVIIHKDVVVRVCVCERERETDNIV